MSAHRAGVLVSLVSAALLLSGCSQVAALAPVGGDALAEVRFGAIDVLLDQDVALLEAPVCAIEGAGPSVTCEGRTVAGGEILVSSSTEGDATLAITIDGVEIFRGSLADVIDEAARP
ncbi:hypothetical protein [Microbacterium sp.]|uniref:hypothetical protein n=1 Tax=Microbacterium sp. TaxID=51671 RepID=UPI003F70D02C